MRNLTLLLAVASTVGCGEVDEPSLATTTSAVTLVSTPSIGPDGAPYFEKMHNLPDHSSAQLNFELEVKNTSPVPVQLDQLDISYTQAGAKFGESPIVGAADLREHYLKGCSRNGFGSALDGTLVLEVPALNSEELSDVQVPSADVFGTVHGTERRVDPQTGKNVDVSRFAAVEIEDGKTLAWTTLVPWFGWEDRANALAPADAETTAYVAVGGARPYGGGLQFAAVKIMRDGTIATRGDGTLWKTSFTFPGCTSAEAIDVERVNIGAADDLYFVAGDAVCAGTSQIALALLDGEGMVVWKTSITPGAKPVHVGGVAVDPATNDLYVVGQFGDSMLVGNFTLAGVRDLLFGPTGTGWNILILPTYDRVFGRDAKVMSDGRIVIAAEGRRIADGVTQLGMWRFNANGTRDLMLGGGQGFVWKSVPGLATARGRDIEIHENETWFTVSGYGESPGRHFVAAAFDLAGNMRTGFDLDGFWSLPTPNVPVVARSFLRGDFITVVGGTGARLAGARFHRLDGSLDDPSVMSSGDRCALLWPDTGVDLAGTSHATNLWIWNDIPQDVHADLHLHAVTGGASIASWGHALSLWGDDPYVEKNFPGDRNDENYEWWYVAQGHEIGTDHRGGGEYSSALGHYVATQRYAYDLVMKRWTGGASDNGVWSSTVEDPQPCDDGKLNCQSVGWGQPIHPIAEGDIIACSWGTEENFGPGVHDVEAACSTTSTVPCFYGNGGNSVRIRHADGKISSYFHMQNTDDSICPVTGPTQLLENPIHVTRDTVLGFLGNSGHSEGAHVHVQLYGALPPEIVAPADLDWTDPAATNAEWKRWESYADSVPLMFHDMIGVDSSLTPQHFPAEATPSIPVAHFGGSFLRHLPSGEAPPETGCTETDPLAPDDSEANQPDGDAPMGNGRPLYCEDNQLGMDEIWVCVENQDSTSECQMCGGETAYPGCPCASQEQCGPDMACWGVPDNVSAGDPIGKCYPTTGAPNWICPYDCNEQFQHNGGWCDSLHPSGQARCVDVAFDDLDIDTCWNWGTGGYVPNIDYDPDVPGSEPCILECTYDSFTPANNIAQCQALHFPDPIPYSCAPNNLCMRPEELP